MKHILNNLTEQEKNAIREQHTGGMKVSTDKFNQLLESKLGDVKPILSEQTKPKMPPSAVNQAVDAEKIQLIQIKVGDALVDLNMMEKTSQGANFYGWVRGNNKEYFQVLFNCGDKKVAMKRVNGPISTTPQQSMISLAALTLLNKASGCDAYVKNQDPSADDVTLAEQMMKPISQGKNKYRQVVNFLKKSGINGYKFKEAIEGDESLGIILELPQDETSQLWVEPDGSYMMSKKGKVFNSGNWNWDGMMLTLVKK